MQSLRRSSKLLNQRLSRPRKDRPKQLKKPKQQKLRRLRRKRRKMRLRRKLRRKRRSRSLQRPRNPHSPKFKTPTSPISLRNLRRLRSPNSLQSPVVPWFSQLMKSELRLRSSTMTHLAEYGIPLVSTSCKGLALRLTHLRTKIGSTRQRQI